jgi:hypothetical protein
VYDVRFGRVVKSFQLLARTDKHTTSKKDEKLVSFMASLPASMSMLMPYQRCRFEHKSIRC